MQSVVDDAFCRNSFFSMPMPVGDVVDVVFVVNLVPVLVLVLDLDLGIAESVIGRTMSR